MGKYHPNKCGFCSTLIADMSLLHVDSVRKSYGDRTVLNDIFLSCNPGDIVGILGRNGSGKSSLLKVIFGSIRSDHKYITLDAVKKDNLYSVRNLIQYLPQHHFLPKYIKIKTLLSCMCNKDGIAQLIKNPDIIPHLDKKPKQLSGGERRIVEILFLLHTDAKVLLLDEPFHSISPLYIEKIKTVIQEKSMDKGIVITDHAFQHILDISTRIVLIKDGNTHQIKDLDELSGHYLPATI